MTASWGAVKRCQNICVYFLTENPEENGVNGALEKKKSENGICSRSDDRSKVAAQGKKSNRKLGAYVQILTEIRSLEALAGCLVWWRAAEAHGASPMPCRIAGHSGSCTALRSLANPLLGW